MQYTCSKSGPTCEVVMNGQFIFSDNQNFRKILHMLDEHEVQQLTLNLAEVNFVDSAALGMLLLLRDKVALKGINMTLARPQGQVKKVFAVSRFDQLFQIVE